MKKYTTVAINEDTHNALMDMKHKLEKETRRSCSFSDVIIYLLSKIEDEARNS